LNWYLALFGCQRTQASLNMSPEGTEGRKLEWERRRVVRARGQGEWANGMETTRDTRYAIRFPNNGQLGKRSGSDAHSGKNEFGGAARQSQVTRHSQRHLNENEERTRRRRSLFLQTIPHFSLRFQPLPLMPKTSNELYVARCAQSSLRLLD